MGICLTQYRMVIGYYNRCKFVTCQQVYSIPMRSCNALLIFLLVLINMLNLLSGDIELHPGPKNIKCRSLRACHVNIRSLSRSKLLAIKSSLVNLYDIITLSETHLHAGIPNNVFSLQNFHEIIRKDRSDGWGGVAMYIRDNIIYKRMHKYERQNIEALWMQFNTIEGKILLCCCYRPPNRANFWTDLTDVLDDVKEDNTSNIILMGDLNADLKTSEGKKLVELCNLHNLSFMVNEPT